MCVCQHCLHLPQDLLVPAIFFYDLLVMIECYNFQDSHRWSLKCWQVGIDDWFPLHKQSISQQISTHFLPWTVKEMYTEFLSHWLFIFQYTRIIYTRKWNIHDRIQHLQKQSGSSDLKRKNCVGDGGLFLCWFWFLSHQVRRRSCGKSAHPIQRVKINWTWTKTGKRQHLYMALSLSMLTITNLWKFMARCNPFQKGTWWKNPRHVLCGDVKVPPGLRGAVFEESILWFVPLVAASQSFAQLSPAPQQSQGEQHTSWNALGWDVWPCGITSADTGNSHLPKSSMEGEKKHPKSGQRYWT